MIGLEADVETGIRNSRFAEEMEFLQEHQELRRISLAVPNGSVRPNCGGTALYVIGAQDMIGNLRRGVPLYDGVQDHTIYPVESWPGYVSMLHLRRFLFENSRVEQVSKKDAVDGVIAFSHCSSGTLDPIHAGVYIGEIGGLDLMFHKYDQSAYFEPMFAKDYMESVQKRIPENLRKPLCVTFHRVRR